MKMPNNPAKYEVLIKQYLRSILDISVKRGQIFHFRSHICTLVWLSLPLSTEKNICEVSGELEGHLRGF